jgi:hypothetical protein
MEDLPSRSLTGGLPATNHLILGWLLVAQPLRSDHGSCVLGLKEFYGLGAARLSGARMALVSENVITVGKLVYWLVPRAVVG